MSKSIGKKSMQEETAPSAGAAPADAEERESAVEELDEALDALPDDDGDDAADGGEDESDSNPLAQVGVSGETSFESAEFEAEDEAADEEGEVADEDDEPDEDEDDEPEKSDEEADDDDDDTADFVVHDADAEDRAEEFERMSAELRSRPEPAPPDDDIAPGGQPRELAELVSICEALIFVSEEPIQVKALADILGEDKGWVQVAVEELAKEFNERGGGLMLREVAGGWQFATRPEHHEHIRAYLKSKPSAKLSLAALETLAVIAYKQPVTVPEILEIRGVQSSSAIKTLLDKRLIIAKGRKETVGRPMMYGTSKDFLLQFGLKDLSELPNVEDFEDLAGGAEIE
ncbi:MAG TPA: SMC-Scp complex subunit ScpB [Pyrinomonadaceae bacterium]|jgi:segregation and condensation protein B|nr:SMC-Scp complex subunit ScpB [Pyrinomonadaceae bacterium]